LLARSRFRWAFPFWLESELARGVGRAAWLRWIASVVGCGVWPVRRRPIVVAGCCGRPGAPRWWP